MLFAQAQTNTQAASNIGMWVIGAIAVLQLVSLAMQVFRYNQAQKREVSFTGECVDKREFDKHVAYNREEHDNIFSLVGGKERGLRAEADEKISKIDVEVRKLGQDMAAVKTETTIQSRTLSHLESKVDSILSKVK